MPNLLSPEIQGDPHKEDSPRNSRHGSECILITREADPGIRFKGEEECEQGWPLLVEAISLKSTKRAMNQNVPLNPVTANVISPATGR